MSQPEQTGLCPCCNRFIGPVRTCPYCGEDALENRSVRVLQRASLALALAGLVCLHISVAARELPRVAIGEVTPAMNFARIHIGGTVTREPYVAREGGEVEYVSFQIDDASGRARVAARGDVARALVERGLVPVPGAGIDATGSLRIMAGRPPRLYLESADHLVVEAAAR